MGITHRPVSFGVAQGQVDHHREARSNVRDPQPGFIVMFMLWYSW